MFTVDYFINKFQEIPIQIWCKRYLTDDAGAHCAAGHCGSVSSCSLNDETTSLANIIKNHPFNKLRNNITDYAAIYNINDGNLTSWADYGSLGVTPKQRILTALHDIKKLQQPAITEVDTIVGKFIPVTFAEIKELQSSN